MVRHPIPIVLRFTRHRIYKDKAIPGVWWAMTPEGDGTWRGTYEDAAAWMRAKLNEGPVL